MYAIEAVTEFSDACPIAFKITRGDTRQTKRPFVAKRIEKSCLLRDIRTD
jgi:hypothetical protein